LLLLKILYQMKVISLLGLVHCSLLFKRQSAQCAVSNADKEDCGNFGIGERGCLQRGCCWQPGISLTAPWCFIPNGDSEPTTTTTTRPSTPLPARTTAPPARTTIPPSVTSSIPRATARATITPTPTATATTLADKQQQEQEMSPGLRIGLIVGGVIAGLAVVGIATLVYHKSKQSKEMPKLSLAPAPLPDVPVNQEPKLATYDAWLKEPAVSATGSGSTATAAASMPMNSLPMNSVAGLDPRVSPSQMYQQNYQDPSYQPSYYHDPTQPYQHTEYQHQPIQDYYQNYPNQEYHHQSDYHDGYQDHHYQDPLYQNSQYSPTHFQQNGQDLPGQADTHFQQTSQDQQGQAVYQHYPYTHEYTNGNPPSPSRPS
jgi:hypothetical protein